VLGRFVTTIEGMTSIVKIPLNGEVDGVWEL
jgi:hypothetical protein